MKDKEQNINLVVQISYNFYSTLLYTFRCKNIEKITIPEKLIIWKLTPNTTERTLLNDVNIEVGARTDEKGDGGAHK